VAEPGRVTHTIDPIFDERSRALVLGTMPSPASRAVGFYYGNPRNRFWPVLAALWDETDSGDNEGRRDLCLRHGVALWDVLASCRIAGASDASIRDPVPNDVGRILRAAPISAVFCTGATAARLYARLVEPATGVSCVRLPSTSPANARMGTGELIEAYGAVKLAADASHATLSHC